jgi:peptidoglycan biosynthesis protein MviN/MurJ (putative lipid II flippase)
VSIPLNIYLINNYDLEGLAYSNLIALTLYNTVRFIFIYKKFNLQPYTTKHGLFLLSGIGLMVLVHLIPTMNNILANILIQSFAYGIGFYVLVNWLNPAPEILNMAHDFIKVKLPGIFKKKK